MKELADKENDMAQYTLGRILLDPESGAYDAKEGMEYLRVQQSMEMNMHS